MQAAAQWESVAPCLQQTKPTFRYREKSSQVNDKVKINHDTTRFFHISVISASDPEVLRLRRNTSAWWLCFTRKIKTFYVSVKKKEIFLIHGSAGTCGASGTVLNQFSSASLTFNMMDHQSVVLLILFVFVCCTSVHIYTQVAIQHPQGVSTSPTLETWLLFRQDISVDAEAKPVNHSLRVLPSSPTGGCSQHNSTFRKTIS